MLFRKLFQMLVVGGAVVGTTSACTPRAEAQSAPKAKDGGVGVKAADAGTASSAGGGVKGW
jgi:hypothetical protein